VARTRRQKELDAAAVKAERVHAENGVKVALGKGQLVRNIEMQRRDLLPVAARREFLPQVRCLGPQVHGDDARAKVLCQENARLAPAAAQVEHNVPLPQIHRARHVCRQKEPSRSY
jgi:hypothetical protein